MVFFGWIELSDRFSRGPIFEIPVEIGDGEIGDFFPIRGREGFVFGV
jgi:hypothetical protein